MSQLPANHRENMRRTGNVYGVDPNTGKHWREGMPSQPSGIWAGSDGRGDVIRGDGLPPGMTISVLPRPKKPFSYRGGLGGLLSRFNPIRMGGGFGGFGGMGGFNPYQQMPRMGGGFFGGFMPRFKRRARPAMPDYSGQITSLEEKIKALQEQLAARQTGSAMPASMPAARPTTASSLIPQVDPVALKELQDRVAGSGIPTPRPAPAIPMPGPSGMEDLGLDLAEIPMGRGRMGGGKTMVKPSSVERIMPMPKPMPEMPSFPMPQIDSMGRVAAPLTRGPVNVAINSPKLGIGRLGGRMMR